MTAPETRTEWGIIGPGMTTPLSMPHWTYADTLRITDDTNNIVTRTVTEWHTP